MKVTDFEPHIDPKILERGRNYFANGAVSHLEEIEENTWACEVQGTELYEVEVELDGDEITRSYCNCPYNMGDVCKHEVAVFFELKGMMSTPSKGKKKKRQTRTDELNQLLKNVKLHELKSFVTELSKKDREFYLELKGHFGKPDSAQTKLHFQHVVQNAFYSLSQRGFMEYGAIYPFCKKIDEVLRKGELYLAQGNPLMALEVAKALVENLYQPFTNSEDGRGDVWSVCDESFSFFAEVIEQLPKEEVEKLPPYINQMSKRYPYSEYGLDTSWEELKEMLEV